MSPSELTKAMADAGAPIDAILIALRAVEEAQAESRAPLDPTSSERSARYRARGGGRITPEVRAAVLERDGHECAYCHVSLRYTLSEPDHEGVCTVHGVFPTMDHIVPVCRGGDSSPENLTPACQACNSRKRDKTADEFRAWRRERGEL